MLFGVRQTGEGEKERKGKFGASVFYGFLIICVLLSGSRDSSITFFNVKNSCLLFCPPCARNQQSLACCVAVGKTPTTDPSVIRPHDARSLSCSSRFIRVVTPRCLCNQFFFGPRPASFSNSASLDSKRSSSVSGHL